MRWLRHGNHHGERPPLPADETEELLARRLVAQRCLYAVDRNTMAADLAKLSLWLATLAKDHPFTFLDHSIRVGDALVGLTRQQIADFHWFPEMKRAFG
jgi:type II restriction/modification system DNA methylase subunit YeeA